MKELSIEEKAKAYDEAIRIAQELYNDSYSSNVGKGYICTVFPELKESEDEIRKEIISALKYANHKGVYDKHLAWLEKQGERKTPQWMIDFLDSYRKKIGCSLDYDEAKDTDSKFLCIKEWLEKQGEQKPADKVEPKFHEGEWVVYECGEETSTLQIARIFDIAYVFSDGSILGIVDEDSLRLWDIAKDAKNGDVLAYKDEISIYKHDIKNCTKEGTNFGGFVYHCCYDGKRFITDSLYSLTEKDKKDIYPATKEQRDTLMKAMADAGYTFDFEKKELKKIEDKTEIPFGAKDSELQEASYHIPKGFYAVLDGNKVIIKKGEKKPAWSEDDEKMKNAIYSCVDLHYDGLAKTSLLIWLKFLKFQKLCVYNPYKAVVESIAKMCNKYENCMCDEKEAKDFLANVAIKCHEAAEYDKNYS